MIKRRVLRRSDSNISILRTQGGTGLSLGQAQASFTNVAWQGQVISIVGKSGPLTTALALASGAFGAWPRCWCRLAIPMSLLDNLPMQAYVYVERLGDVMPIEKSDLLQGTLDMLILKIVALGPVHGYGISLRIRQISQEVLQVQQGSLYPALHRLEKRGWLAAEWGESEKGRQAKFYKLSAKGRKQLASEESNWKRLAGAVVNILQTVE